MTRCVLLGGGGGGGCVGGVDRVDDDAANSGRAGYMIRFAIVSICPKSLELVCT